MTLTETSYYNPVNKHRLFISSTETKGVVFVEVVSIAGRLSEGTIEFGSRPFDMQVMIIARNFFGTSEGVPNCTAEELTALLSAIMMFND